MSTERNERLWLRYYYLSVERGKDTLAIICDEENDNIRKWLLRGERATLTLGTMDSAAVSLTCGYLMGCIKGALSGQPCPKDENVTVADQS